MILDSYAKVNLYLEVLKKRQDNYHSLRTIFERISLHDTIILKPRSDNVIKIISRSPYIPKGNTNLAYKSAKLLQDSLHINKGVDIRIIKRIPAGSGMGGGSSNAATVLLGLNKLWGLKLTRTQLLGYAKKLGADVPFFIYDTSFAQASARGDKIKPLVGLNIRLWHILAVPKLHVSTPFIYQKWDELTQKAGLTPLQISKAPNAKTKFVTGLTRPKSNVKLLYLGLKQKDLSLIKQGLFNSLEEVTTREYPQVRSLINRLTQQGLQSILMSGSGPAIFAIVSSRKEAVTVSRRLRKMVGGQVFVARTR